MRRSLAALALILALGTAFAAPPVVFLSNSEDGAQIHCPLDKVVWLDSRAHRYYYRSSKHYAATAKGGFACLKEVKSAGDKPGK